MFHKTTQYRQLDTATLLLACGFFVKDIYSILASSNNFSKEFALCFWVYYDTRLVVLLYILRQDVACLFGWILHHHLYKEKWHQEYMKPQDFLILLLYPNMQPQLPNLSNQRIRPERMSKFISYFSIKMANKLEKINLYHSLLIQSFRISTVPTFLQERIVLVPWHRRNFLNGCLPKNIFIKGYFIK